MFRSIRSLSLALSTALLLPLAACGGGGGGGDDVMLQGQALLYPVDSHTIYWSNGQAALHPNQALFIGDHTGPGAMRSLVKFNLPTLPEGAVVTYAYVTLHRVKTLGSPNMLGAMRADHVDWPLATALDPSFGTGNTLGSPNIGEFQDPTYFQINAPWHQWLDVSPQVAQDVALDRDTSAFRFYLPMPTNSDIVLDAFQVTGYHALSNKTYDVELRITYEYPQP